MVLASIDGSMAQRLGPFGGPKWFPKALPERRKTFIWIRIFTCEVALRRLGKDILRDKRFGLKKEAQNGSGLHWRIDGAESWSCLEVQNGFQRRLQSEGKPSFGYIFSCAKWL